MESCILHIDYDEFEQSTYRAVAIGDRRFETGDPVVDFRAAIQYARAHYAYVSLSSDCDNFVKDGDRFRWIEDDELGEIITYV